MSNSMGVIPLRDCSPLQLAILSARAMGLEESSLSDEARLHEGHFMVAIVLEGWDEGADGEAGTWSLPPSVITTEGDWNPAEDPGDALRLMAWAASQGKRQLVQVEPYGPGIDGGQVHTSRGVSIEVQAPTPEGWLGTLARALTESTLSALGVGGWEETDV